MRNINLVSTDAEITETGAVYLNWALNKPYFLDVEICLRPRTIIVYLNDLEEFHWFYCDVVLHHTVDHSAGAQLFAVDAFRRVYHSAAFVNCEVVPVDEGRRGQETEAQAVDDRRIVAPIEAQLGDEVADETVRRKFFHDEELANV